MKALLGDININVIEVLHHYVSRNGNSPVLIHQVTELGICFLKFTCNGEIFDHTKEEDKLGIENAVVQTRSMCSVLELDRDKDLMAFDAWGLLRTGTTESGEVQYQGAVSSTKL
jgi:hypothetical protein